MNKKSIEKETVFFDYNRMATAGTSDAQTRKQILEKMTDKAKNLRELADKIDLFVECTSFTVSREELSSLSEKVDTVNCNLTVIDKTFSDLNSGLYQLSSSSEEMPCPSQDANNRLEVETFSEKVQVTVRGVKKTRIYLENPVYMESALRIADSEDVNNKASKFLRQQWWTYVKTFSKFYPEEADTLPDASEGLNCPPPETFDKIRMPLIHILDKLCDILQSKRLANVEVHDNLRHLFRDINKKYESLFEKTLWDNEEWIAMWGGFSQV